VSLWDAYHGRTMLTLAASWPHPAEPFRPFMTHVIRIPQAYCYRCPFQMRHPSCDLFCVQFAERTIRQNCDAPPAAVLMEPIQGNGGMICFPPEYHQAMLAMCRRLEDLHVETTDLIFVFDKGINSQDNVDQILYNMHLVGSIPRDESKDLLEKASKRELAHVYTTDKGHVISGWRTRETFYGREFEVVVQHNPATQSRQEETYERQKARILEGVEAIRASCLRKGRGRKPGEKGIIDSLGDLVHKNLRGIFDYGIERTEEGGPCPWIKVKEKAEEAYRRSLGMNVVFTDKVDLSTEEILRTYNSKSMIEEDFRWMEDKVVIPLWPFFVRKDLAVRAHVFLVLLGLMLYRLVQHDLGRHSMYLSTLVTYLDEIRVALVSEGRRRPRFIMEKMEREAARLFSKLDMARFIPS